MVDELGSGVRNIHKYGKTYFGYEPQIIEDEIFKIIFKTLENSSTHQVTHQATRQADDKINELIEFCKEPKTRVELQEFMEMKDRYHFRTRILKPLIEAGTIKLTIPDKPRSPHQKYYSGNKYNQQERGEE